MNKAKAFGGLLARIRREQGFPTAYSFHKSCEGRRTLGLTFRNYLNLEHGKYLPETKRFKAIFAALGLDRRPEPARELVAAYFAALGLEEFAHFLGSARAPEGGGESPTLAELAARHEIQKRTVHYSAAQWKLFAEDFDAYLCDDVLNLTPGGIGFPELARRTGLSQPAARRAVKTLAAAGLAKVSGDRARHALHPQMVLAPLPNLPAFAGLKAAIRKSEDRVAARGALVRNSIMRIRLTPRNLKLYEKHLDHLIDLASLYGNPEVTPGSAIYMVRGQILKIYEG